MENHFLINALLTICLKKQLHRQSLKKSNQNITTVILKRADIDMGTFYDQTLSTLYFLDEFTLHISLLL